METAIEIKPFLLNDDEGLEGGDEDVGGENDLGETDDYGSENELEKEEDY